MQGLTIIVAGADPERLRAALEVATANAALDRATRLFLQSGAVALLRQPMRFPADAKQDEHGLPTLADLLGEAMAMGVAVTACQSGLALAGLTAEALPQGVTTGGLLEALSRRGDEQLLMV